MVINIIKAKRTILGLKPLNFPEQSDFLKEDNEWFELPDVPQIDQYITDYGKVVWVEWDLKMKLPTIYCVNER